MSNVTRGMTLGVVALVFWRAERAAGWGVLLAVLALAALAWRAIPRTGRRHVALPRDRFRPGTRAPNAPRLDAAVPIPSTFADGQDSFYYFESRPDALLGLRDELEEQVPWDDHPFLARPVG